MPKDTTEILVGKSSGKIIAEALREFWRAHSVTMGKKDGLATICISAGSGLF